MCVYVQVCLFCTPRLAAYSLVTLRLRLLAYITFILDPVPHAGDLEALQADGVEEQRFQLSYRQGLADNAGIPLSGVSIRSMEAGSIVVRTEVTYRQAPGHGQLHVRARPGSSSLLCEVGAGIVVLEGLLCTWAAPCLTSIKSPKSELTLLSRNIPSPHASAVEKTAQRLPRSLCGVGLMRLTSQACMALLPRW